jgi:archaellum component FlaC
MTEAETEIERLATEVKKLKELGERLRTAIITIRDVVTKGPAPMYPDVWKLVQVRELADKSLHGVYDALK